MELSREELIALCAEDTEFFYLTFFPRTFRQPSGALHLEMDGILDGPDRYVAMKVFRGGAKTTRCRAFCAKRISFGISRTIVFVGNAQKNAIYSLRWLRRQVEKNTAWASFFGLKPGHPWTDEHLCIRNEILEIDVNVIALGITSQIRGINLDDYRPDLIIADDVDNEESTKTPEQREKVSDLLGSLEKGLVPPTEDVNAKMVVLQTPINLADYITTISQSTKWRTATFSCFDENGESTWPERYPTEFLKKEKADHITLRKLHLWLREMECKVTSKETAPFDADWLRFWDKEQGLPPGMDKILAIDPASSDSKKADFQALGAVGFKGPDVYLLDYTMERGEMPDALAKSFFEFIRTYQPRKGGVETTAYQRVLKWYLEKEMRAKRTFLVLESIDDKRKKSDRLIQNLSGLAAYGHLYVKSTHVEFIEQFTDYTPNSEVHDDLLDMLSIAVMTQKRGQGELYEGEFMQLEEDEKLIPELPEWRVPI